MSQDSLLFDFGTDKSLTWYALSDMVMGGRSQSKLMFSENTLRFEGHVSFDNNGGFSSVRGDHEILDLSEYTTVTVRYRVNNQSLSLNFNYHSEWYRPKFKALLPETGVEWKTVILLLNSLKEYRVGQPTGNKIESSKLKRIMRLGIMTADKKEGAFNAEIDFIRFD